MTRRQRTATLAGAAIGALLAGVPVAAQAPGAADSSPPPTPAQTRYLDGLKTVGRGVAQLKDGVTRVARYQSDSAQLRLAGRRLGGLCGSGGSFMRQGRARMAHTAYGDSARVIARRLNTQIDALIGFLPTCQREAGRTPQLTAAEVLSRLRDYEVALQRFREAVILPAAARTPAGS
jgi:hypothetical protein